MRISEIATELGKTSKEIMEALNKNGASYKNAANSISDKEVAALRKTFGTAAAKGKKEAAPAPAKKEKEKEKDRKAPAAKKEEVKPSAPKKEEKKKEEKKDKEKGQKPAPAAPEEPKKPSTVLLKRSKTPEPEPEQPKAPVAVIRRERSYIPEEERAKMAEQQAQEPPAAPVAPAAPTTAPQPEETPVTPSGEPAPTDESRPAEPAISPLDEMLLKPSFRIEAIATDRPLTPALRPMGDQPQPEGEEDKPVDHRHRKRKVVISETEDDRLPAQKKPVAARFFAKKKGKGDEQVKVQAKIRGVDVSVFKTEEDEAEAKRRAAGKRRVIPRQRPAPMPKPNPTKAIKKIIRIENAVVVSELARRMGIKAADIIRKLMMLGETLGINDRIPFETAGIVAGEFGFQVENVAM
ncbi:MAG TPA: translation initiation factor IF-2 N-terminal domain-containing protein, partial [bacterium]|nr:translation initiation factor IF-2 N-terminal domain-containing protein [bacterium]